MCHTRLLSAAVLVLLGTGAANSAAQTARPERPYRGLFGSGTADAGQLLTASVTFGAGYDDNLHAEAQGSRGPASGLPGATNRGLVGNGAASLAYALDADAIQLAASGGASVRYYPAAQRESLRSSNARLHVSIPVTDGTSLALDTTATHRPHALDSLFPVLSDAPSADPTSGLDTALAPDYYLSYSASTALSHRVSRRTSLSGNYTYRGTRSPEASRDFRYQNVGGHLTHNVGRGLDVRLGYGYGEARYADGAHRRGTHSFDGGLDYSRALSFSRRTTLAFGTGTTAVESGERLQFRVTGRATLTREIGRTWSANVSYGRRIVFLETFQEPVLSDAVTAAIGGLVSRRVQFDASGQAALGTVGASDPSRGFDSYYGVATMSVALARFMSLGVTYAYYHHRFAGAVVLPAGAPRTMDRHSVRANVNLWAPLYQRTRRADAAR